MFSHEISELSFVWQLLSNWTQFGLVMTFVLEKSVRLTARPQSNLIRSESSETNLKSLKQAIWNSLDVNKGRGGSDN